MEDIYVIKRDGSKEPLNVENIRVQTMEACKGLPGTTYEEIEARASVNFFNGIKTEDIQTLIIDAAQSLIDVDRPNYAYAAARLMLSDLYRTVEYNYDIVRDKTKNVYDKISLQLYFDTYGERILSDFYKKYTREEIEEINKMIVPDRDKEFAHAAVRLIKAQYLARCQDILVVPGEEEKGIVELPQHMIMCIVMNNCQHEDKSIRLSIIKELYECISRQYFIPATPHLSYGRIKNGSTASCLVTSMKDNIESIFINVMPGVAIGTKLGAGFGIDITRLRSLGSDIGIIKNASKGKVPLCVFLDKLSYYIDQGGKLFFSHHNFARSY